MTAHEAMLLRTPVIGSGRGGMHELLTGGGQLICHSEGELRTTVIRLLSCPAECERRGQTGEQYARQFDIAKFEASWLNLIRSLLD